MATSRSQCPSGASSQELGLFGSPIWYMWRGDLIVGTTAVGTVSLTSEHMVCIPALGGILKMTRIAKYDDLWTKILQCQPCYLSQREAVNIGEKIVTVHRIHSPDHSFQELVAELSLTSKPQLLVCHLFNDGLYVEVVLVPHCPALEQCGIRGYGPEIPHYLHIIFVTQKSEIHITSLHQKIDAVDISQCIVMKFKNSYATLEDIQFFGGSVIVHHTKMDQFLSSPQLPKLCASSNIRFGVYGLFSHIVEGKVRSLLASARLLLLLHHTSLLDCKTGDVLQMVCSNGNLHTALLPSSTYSLCSNLLAKRSREPKEEKYQEALKKNLNIFMRCVEVGAGYILGGNQESVCANLSPASPMSDYLTCLKIVHRCYNFTHRYTAVLIGKNIKKANQCQTSLYQLCSAEEFLLDFPKVTSKASTK